MKFDRHFSAKTVKALNAKGVVITGIVAVPAFSDDKYFSDTAFNLVYEKEQIGFIRTHAQVRAMAASSWTPEEYFGFQDPVEASGVSIKLSREIDY
jgi:hypothetical protein